MRTEEEERRNNIMISGVRWGNGGRKEDKKLN